jgi:hypothetical protein
MFPHPANAPLFACMKQDAKVVDLDHNPVYTRDGYEARTHSDLTSILYNLVQDTSVSKGYAYGRPVMAGANGLIFAFAGGTSGVFFKLRKDQFDQARKDGGWSDPTYGEDWVQFKIGRRPGVSVDWREATKHWANVGLQNALRE